MVTEADRDYWMAEQFGPARYRREPPVEPPRMDGWDLLIITPGFFQIGDDEGHLLWVNEHGLVHNGGYWLWSVDGSEDALSLHPGLYQHQIEYHGETWPPYVAHRVGYEWEGMPAAARKFQREWQGPYNAVIQAFIERRALGLAMQSREQSELAAAYYRNPNTEDDWSRYAAY